MMSTRIMFIAIVCLAAAIADSNVDEVVPEHTVALLQDEELLEEQAQAQADALAEEAAFAQAGGESSEVNAMDELKAYAQVAAQSKFFKSTDDRKRNALMYIISEYSKDPKTNKHLAGGSSNNIVTQYGLMMGKLEAKANGVFKYLLQAVDDAILQGKSCFTYAKHGKAKPKDFIVFDSKLLGLQDTPDYFFKFQVTPDAWNAAKSAIPKGQTAKAITAKLMKDKKSFFETELDRLIAVSKEAEKSAYAGAVKDAHTAITKSFADAPDTKTNMEVIQPLSPAGLLAAQSNKEYQATLPADMDTLKKQALIVARKKVRAEAATANAARITRETEEKARLAAIEKAEKEVAAKERVAKEKAKKEAAQKAAAARAERNSKEYTEKNRMAGQCCTLLNGCHTCCDKCPRDHHHVWPAECGTSRKCNRL